MNNRKKINEYLFEVESKKNDLNSEYIKIKKKIKDSITAMLRINVVIIAFFSISTLGLVTSAGIFLEKALTYILPEVISLCGINTAIKLKKISTLKKEKKSIQEQKKYVQKIFDELLEIKKANKIKINSIHNIKKCEKNLVLIKEYNKNKNLFIREYKKNNLVNFLKDSYYTSCEKKYIYDRTKEEIKNKTKRKVKKMV